jgi:hypothetical protein
MVSLEDGGSGLVIWDGEVQKGAADRPGHGGVLRGVESDLDAGVE